MEPPEPEDPLERVYRAANVASAEEFLQAWRGQRERFQATYSRLAEQEAHWELLKGEFARLREEATLRRVSSRGETDSAEDDLRLRVAEAVKRLERSAVQCAHAEGEVATTETCLRTLVTRWVAAGFGPDKVWPGRAKKHSFTQRAPFPPVPWGWLAIERIAGAAHGSDAAIRPPAVRCLSRRSNSCRSGGSRRSLRPRLWTRGSL